MKKDILSFSSISLVIGIGIIMIIPAATLFSFGNLLHPQEAYAQLPSSITNRVVAANEIQYIETASSGPNVYVVWVIPNSNNGNDGEILFKKSSDGGRTFGDTINLSNNAGNSYSPSIATSGNNVYVAWSDNTPGKYEIMFRHSVNNGTSFSDTRVLTSSDNSKNTYSFYPRLASEGSNNVYLTYAAGFFNSNTGSDETSLIFKRSINSGSSFSDGLTVANDVAIVPEIAATPEHIYLAWLAGEDFEATTLYFAASTDSSGSSFGHTQKISSGGTESSLGKMIAADNSNRNNNVYLTWSDYSLGYSQVFFRKSADNGNSFDKMVTLSNSNAEATDPDMAISGPRVDFVWIDHVDGYEQIMSKSSADHGNSFDNTRMLTDGTQDSDSPRLISSPASGVTAVWQKHGKSGDISQTRALQ